MVFPRHSPELRLANQRWVRSLTGQSSGPHCSSRSSVPILDLYKPGNISRKLQKWAHKHNKKKAHLQLKWNIESLTNSTGGIDYYRNTGSKDILNSSSSNFKSCCFSYSLDKIRVPGTIYGTGQHNNTYQTDASQFINLAYWRYMTSRCCQYLVAPRPTLWGKIVAL